MRREIYIAAFILMLATIPVNGQGWTTYGNEQWNAGPNFPYNNAYSLRGIWDYGDSYYMSYYGYGGIYGYNYGNGGGYGFQATPYYYEPYNPYYGGSMNPLYYSGSWNNPVYYGSWNYGYY